MFEISLKIERPAATVFAYLQDIEAAPRWYSAVESVTRLSDGPVGCGSRFVFTRQIAGRRIQNTVEVTEFQDEKLLTLASVSGPTPFSYRYRLDRDGAATILHLEGTISGDGLGGPIALLAPLASRFFEQGMRANIANLKRILEARLGPDA
ncbi:SRPBCC family protein [Mesorhizobium sp. M0152]|uniref:SRPBCC family protein n=1 Tax=unclassified Mesorhizobium TaxID=325217 RepID=UPI00333BC67A